MVELRNIDEITGAIEANEVVLLFVQAPDCGLCAAMMDRTRKIVKEFTHIVALTANVLEVPQMVGTFLVKSAPTILLFYRGKEYFRSGTFIDFDALEKRIAQLASAV